MDWLIRAELEAARDIVARHIMPTPTHNWPLLDQRAGGEVWVKHENHTPVGAFKVRGGLVYLTRLKAEYPDLAGVITATTGNHGQSVGRAARMVGLSATIVVPKGNNPGKSAAMAAQGVDLIEQGDDFQSAKEFAERLAAERCLHMVPSFHPWLVQGVASYGLELFEAQPDLDTVYVPIGLGSGICGVIAARDALGMKTEVVGVVAEGAPCYALSYKAGRVVATNGVATIAEGLAVRQPDALALEIIHKGAVRIVTVSDDEISAAMAAYFTDTHNLAEGAGAATLAARLQERDVMAGKKTGVVLSGGNVDKDLLVRVLAGKGAGG
ncbi:threonine dehydratase [bacterium SCSIO 12827]|nr:threonine dehydratase [bacterium SCSIO 12827]